MRGLLLVYQAPGLIFHIKTYYMYFKFPFLILARVILGLIFFLYKLISLYFTERVVHNLSWVETDLWYDYKDEVLYLGPAAEAESFPSPESYTVTTDSGRVVHRMTTDNQVHCK